MGGALDRLPLVRPTRKRNVQVRNDEVERVARCWLAFPKPHAGGITRIWTQFVSVVQTRENWSAPRGGLNNDGHPIGYLWTLIRGV